MTIYQKIKSSCLLFLIHVEYYIKLNVVLSPIIALMVTKTVLIKFKIKILCHDSSIDQLLPSFLALNGQLAGLLVQPFSFPEQRKMKNKLSLSLLNKR